MENKFFAVAACLIFFTAGLFAQSSVSLAFEETNLDEKMSLPNPFDNMDDTGYTVKSLDVKGHQRNILRGVLYLPENHENKKLPTVIISHGLDSSSRYLLDYGIYLSKSGYAVYLYDFSGGSTLSFSDGDLKGMSVETEKQDLKAVYSFISRQDFVDKENIFLCGECLGGFVSAYTASDLKDKVKGMILLCPDFNLPSDMNHLVSQENQPYYTVQNVQVGRKYVTDAARLNIAEICRKYSGPVLIIHGSADDVIDVSTSRQAASLYDNADLEVIMNAPHSFYRTTYEISVIQYMKDFIKENAS